jgi:hypothetical protein
MDLLFTINSGVTAGKEKVGDTNFLLHYPSVNRNMMWSEIAPYVRQVTQTQIITVIGKPLYDDLANKVQSNVALTIDQFDLVEALKDSIANFVVASALPKKKTMLSSMGAVENNASDGTTQASLWGFKATLYTSFQDAGIHLDRALAICEKAVFNEVAYFDLWKNDESYNVSSTDFFRTTKEFNEYHNINMSRRTFIAMRTIIQEVSQSKVRAILCKAQYDALKSKVGTNDLSASEIELLKYVRKVVCKNAVMEAADALPVLPEQDGFRIVTSIDSVDQRTYSVETIKGAILGIKEQAMNSGATATADLIEYLYQNKDTFPLWRDSTCCKVDENTSLVYCVEDGAVML